MNDPNFALSEDEESYYAAACYAAGIVFSPIGGILSGCIGRKKSIIIISLLGIIQKLCNSRTTEFLPGRSSYSKNLRTQFFLGIFQIPAV